MKDTGKGFLKILLSLLIIAGVAYVAYAGIGKNHNGSAKDITLGLDLAGGVSITYQANKENPTAEEMNDTVYKLQKRVENYSTEASVYQEGSNRVNVDIPGVSDADEILEALGKAGSIEFKDEDGNLVIDGSDIETASAETVQGSSGATEYQVKLTLNASGTEKFADATSTMIGERIAIWYDGNQIQAPTVQSAITDGVAVITGQEDYKSADELASIIRIGALPLELNELRSTVVGAKLGTEAIDTSLLAGLIGSCVVILFMLIVYRIPGLASSLALCFYIAIMVIVLAVFNVTLTLPGIAGILLSIGMAVDANVIIFTRIKEELGAGKTVRSAIKLGFDKALSAIIDGNITTLIAAAVLWFKGSGTVKGFAQTLAIGIILSMLTALFVTKFILNGFYELGLNKIGMYGVKKDTKVYNYVGHRGIFFGISGLMIVATVVMLFVNSSQIGSAFNYGLDFVGGTSMNVTFEQEITSELKLDVEKQIAQVVGETPEISEVKGENELLIKTKELDKDTRFEVSSMLAESFGVSEDKIEVQNISGSVSDEMKADAVWSVAISSVFMLIYIWIRFKDITFGAGAVLALLHDVSLVILVYAAAKISVGNTFIACILTILGYSINATIVIFDRIRENRKDMRKNETLAEVVNKSISQTFSRSLNTSLTTLFMVVALVILGVDSIQEFAIPMMAGIICGGYSSVCIAGTLWYTFKQIGSKKIAKKSKK